MRKKVVREERLGMSPAIKVIYEDGTWGLRMASPGEELPEAGPVTYPEVAGQTGSSTGSGMSEKSSGPTMLKAGPVQAAADEEDDSEEAYEDNENPELTRALDKMTDDIDAEEKDLLTSSIPDEAVEAAFQMIMRDRAKEALKKKKK